MGLEGLEGLKRNLDFFSASLITRSFVLWLLCSFVTFLLLKEIALISGASSEVCLAAHMPPRTRHGYLGGAALMVAISCTHLVSSSCTSAGRINELGGDP